MHYNHLYKIRRVAPYWRNPEHLKNLSKSNTRRFYNNISSLSFSPKELISRRLLTVISVDRHLVSVRLQHLIILEFNFIRSIWFREMQSRQIRMKSLIELYTLWPKLFPAIVISWVLTVFVDISNWQVGLHNSLIIMVPW